MQLNEQGSIRIKSTGGALPRCRLFSTALLAADLLILSPDRLALAIVPALLGSRSHWTHDR
jgi:hypothetical protein